MDVADVCIRTSRRIAAFIKICGFIKVVWCICALSFNHLVIYYFIAFYHPLNLVEANIYYTPLYIGHFITINHSLVKLC